MNRRGTRSALVALVLATAVSVSFTAAAEPRPADTAPKAQVRAAGPDAAVLKRQHVLDELANRITLNKAEDRRHELPGFAGLVVDPDDGVLRLYWKGVVPRKVRSVAASAPAGTRVEFLPARHSAAEVVAGREKIVTATKAGRRVLAGDADWHTLTVAPDGSGLPLAYEPEQGLSTQRTRATSAALETSAEQVTGVSVSVSTEPRPQATGRQNDTSPWWGGAAIISSVKPMGCSTAFAVRLKTGRPGLLTAAHCGDWGGFTDPTGEIVGGVGAAKLDRDTTVIDVGTTSGTVAGRYYDGPWTTSDSKSIVRADYNNNGDYVCTSGAMSGVHCNLRIYADNSYVHLDNGQFVSPVIKAARTDMSNVSHALGDSGGPVVTTADGTYGPRMAARGIISAGIGGPVVCVPGETRNPSTRCFGEVGYVAIRRVLADFELTLVTD
ncbi:hypothetical protein [Streptomyces sp. NPDC097619]|uniref:hypothetical protein n=1 Tax=Streptomyces sp. NPDC097619 TaxID=3157228 RepID=UPI003324ED90